MKIAVLIKHTVDVRKVKIDPDTGVPAYEGKAGLDRPDLHAISAAIDLAESGEASITMVGLGPAEMKDDLISAIATAVGNAEAKHILVSDEADTLFTARTLADVLKADAYDVIIAAKLSEVLARSACRWQSSSMFRTFPACSAPSRVGMLSR